MLLPERVVSRVSRPCRMLGLMSVQRLVRQDLSLLPIVSPGDVRYLSSSVLAGVAPRRCLASWSTFWVSPLEASTRSGLTPVLPFSVPLVLRTGRRHSGILVFFHFTSVAYRHRILVTLLPLALQGASLGHFAAVAPDTAILRLLMERGVRLGVQDHQGSSPVHWAAGSGRLDSVKLLIEEAGVDPKQRNNGGLSPLHLAASNGHLEIVRYLIEERGMDPTEIDGAVGLKGHELR